MRIKLSDTVGFCFGVKHAVDLSKKALSANSGDIFSVGPIIHNPQVTNELSKMGLRVVGDIGAIKKGTIIISSHGAGAKSRKKGLKIIDATCPFVKKIQDHVKGLYRDGYDVVIVGKKEHPEVKALVDFTDGKAKVVKDAKEVKSLKFNSSKVGVVSQSTYSRKVFLGAAAALAARGLAELKVINTVCRDTMKRQDAVRRLAYGVEAVIVVGGKASSNTRRLVEVCREAKKAAYHIEKSSDINPSWLAGRESIGVASGASTPDWVVEGVIHRIEEEVKNGKNKRS